MAEYNPFIQVVISLIILLLMGYIAYNIYIIELHTMFKGSGDIRKEIEISRGVLDYKESPEHKFSTVNKAHVKFLDITPSTNQQGGAEYSYNFWLYVDKEKIKKGNEFKKDIVLFFKGEKNTYYNNDENFNCSSTLKPDNTIRGLNIITKNPLVRINHDGSKLAIDYNNILSPDSYQHRSNNKDCDSKSGDWNEKNNNLLGVYDINFDSRWYMITIVMKEISDNNNILSNNRAECKIYINGYEVFNKKVETRYDGIIHSATYKNNNSPFYINPNFTNNTIKTDANESPFFNTSEFTDSNTLKIGDIKYFNYAINKDVIAGILHKGLNKEEYKPIIIDQNKKYNMVSADEFESSEIKEL
jgi:hypothetical protein